MSMPQFPHPDTILTRDEAINAILTSIAMEETALSHILNAEGEKIQYAIKHIDSCNSCAGIQKLLKVNESAAFLVEQINDMQMLLKNKMRLAAGFLPPNPEKPRPPEKPCPPPKPGKPDKPEKPNKPCFKPQCRCRKPDCSYCSCCSCHTASVSAVFTAIPCVWYQDTALPLDCAEPGAHGGVKICYKRCAAKILLPADRPYKIEFELTLSKNAFCSVCAEAEICCGYEVIHSEKFEDKSDNAGDCRAYIKGALFFQTPCADKSKDTEKDCSLTIRLRSPRRVNIISGKMIVY